MKIYRVVPDSFATNSRLKSEQLFGVEDIYYKMGYTSFLGKRGYHEFNTLVKRITEEGKYFYLFAEDAIQQGFYLISSYHGLRMDTCLVVEYDVPEDIILKKIGYGDYAEDIISLYVVESYIGKSDLGNKVITTNEINNETKIENLVESLNNSLKRMQEYKFSAFADTRFYTDYFDVTALKSIIDDKEKIKMGILNSSFYNAFMNEHGDLINCPYITGRIFPLNMEYISKDLGNWNKVAEYYQSIGLRCEFSSEQNDFKDELLYQIDTPEQDKEKIKRLLKEKKYI